MLDDKRGTHVGFVISFVIFVTFLIFMYSLIVDPIKTPQDKKFILDNIKIKMEESISSNLTIFSVSVNDTSQSCVRLNNLTNEFGVNSKSIIKDESGKTQTSYILTNDLEISRTNINNNLFKIYYSEKFDSLNSSGETPCNSVSYTKGIVKKDNYFFETEISDLMYEYETNYNDLKNELDIPKINDFIFNFEYANGTIIKTERVIPSVNIYAKEFPIQYVDKDGNILLGKLNIQVF